MVATAMIVPFSLGVGAKYCSDIAISNWARDEINYVTDNEYIEPYSDGKYKCGTEITRADVALMIYRYDGSNSTSTNTGYTDVLPGSKYAKAVTWAKDKGIMLGVSSTQFDPFEGIKREDFAVLLLRYAKYKSVNSRRLSANSNALSAFTDVDDVHSYALDAMKWAVTQGIIGGTSPTELSPREHVDRRVAAVLLSRFNLKIERFRWGKENYSFVNSSNNFTDGNYYISSRDLSTLRYYCELNNKLGGYNYILNHINDSWEGSCYGMAATSILSKAGKINIPGNFGTDSQKTLYSLSASDNKPLRSAINYYQMSQYAFSKSRETVAPDNVDEMLNSIDTIGPVIFSFWREGGSGHAVVAYDYAVNSNGSVSLYVYDNNYPNQVRTVRFSAGKTSCTYSNSQETISVDRISYTSFDSFFDRFDYDMEFNDFGSGNSQNSTNVAENMSETDAQCDVVVSLTGAFSIENAEGEVLTYSGGELSGDIDVLSEGYTVNGPYTPSDILLTIPHSSRFRFTSGSKNAGVSLSQDGHYSYITGDNVDSVVFEGGNVDVNGNDMKLDIAVATDNDKMIRLRGISSNGLSYRFGGGKGCFVGIESIGGATLFDCMQTDTDKIFTDVSLKEVNGEISFRTAGDLIDISNRYMAETKEEN